MCGIFGWNLRKGAMAPARLRTIASILALRNEARGKQSWGCYADGEIVRSVGAISRMRSSTMRQMVDSSILMAHTRYPTHGQITPANAHPFISGAIIGAHNGIIYNHDELNLRYGRRHEVDSMHIFDHLSAGLPLDDIEGYGAIEFVDASEQLWLSRFNGGELSVAKTSAGMFWSSLRADLVSALRLGGVKPTLLSVRENALHHCDKENLWIYPDIGISKGFSLFRWDDFKFSNPVANRGKHRVRNYQHRSGDRYPLRRNIVS